MSDPLLQIRNHHSVACGDIGWNSVHEVRDGKVGELVLGREELAWLQACWKAAAAP